jgi:phospholipid/cholesterol/gamma-HCH transport system substrate-binding protein
MRADKIGYFLVGLFVLVMASGLVALLTVLAGRGGRTETYYTSYANVSGLQFGTPVFFEGFHAGQIEAIEPGVDGGRTEFRVALSVLAELKIPIDSKVEIVQPKLLSGRALSIAAGRKDSFVEPGGKIPGGEASGLAALPGLVSGGQDLIDDARQLLTEATAAMAHINLWVTDDMSRIAGQYEALPVSLQQEVELLAGNLRTTVAAANAVIERANLFLSDENAESVSRTLSNIETLTATLDKTSRELSQLGTDAKGLVSQVRNLLTDNKADIEGTIVDLRYTMETIAGRIDSVTYNLEGTSRNMYEFSRQIRLNPGLLLGGTAQTEATEVGTGR